MSAKSFTENSSDESGSSPIKLNRNFISKNSSSDSRSSKTSSQISKESSLNIVKRKNKVYVNTTIFSFDNRCMCKLLF